MRFGVVLPTQDTQEQLGRWKGHVTPSPYGRSAVTGLSFDLAEGQEQAPRLTRPAAQA